MRAALPSIARGIGCRTREGSVQHRACLPCLVQQRLRQGRRATVGDSQGSMPIPSSCPTNAMRLLPPLPVPSSPFTRLPPVFALLAQAFSPCRRRGGGILLACFCATEEASSGDPWRRRAEARPPGGHGRPQPQLQVPQPQVPPAAAGCMACALLGLPVLAVLAHCRAAAAAAAVDDDDDDPPSVRPRQAVGMRGGVVLGSRRRRRCAAVRNGRRRVHRRRPHVPRLLAGLLPRPGH